MGKPQPKSTVEKDKPSTTRHSIPTNVQRRTTAATNVSRRRTIVTVMNDGNQDNLNDGEVVGRNNPSIPPNQSDMSGDEDAEESQRCIGVEKKISPTRTSMVHEFAEKVSPKEYKCKLCSKIYRCGTGN